MAFRRCTVFAAFMALVMTALAAAPWSCAAAAEIPIPDDYRMDHYWGPTPSRLPGATVTDTGETARLAASGAVHLIFVESLERAAAPPRLWLLTRPRPVIPGSVWLPNVGKGAPETDEIAFFRAQLDRLRGEKPDAGFLFYCYLDCWVSWNAARRALRLGYGPVYWYPDGIDGWMLEELATEPGHPVAMP